MPAAGVRGDGEHGVAFGAHQPGAGRQIERGLLLDGAVRAVAFGGIGGAEEEGVGGLVSFEVEDAQGLALLDFMDPPVARRLRPAGRTRRSPPRPRPPSPV